MKSHTSSHKSSLAAAIKWHVKYSFLATDISFRIYYTRPEVLTAMEMLMLQLSVNLKVDTDVSEYASMFRTEEAVLSIETLVSTYKPEWCCNPE
jgi:hypothetical protein